MKISSLNERARSTKTLSEQGLKLTKPSLRQEGLQLKLRGVFAACDVQGSDEEAQGRTRPQKWAMVDATTAEVGFQHHLSRHED